MSNNSKRKNIVGVSALLVLIIVVAMIVGCDNLTTRGNLNSENQPKITYTLTAHEWVILQYEKRFDMKRIENLIAEKEQFTSVRNEEICVDELTQFLIDNLDVWGDEDLFDKIIEEAKIKFSISDDIEILNPFSNAGRRVFFDNNEQYDGVNILRLNIDENQNVTHDRETSLGELQKLYEKEGRQNHNQYERENFETMFSMVINRSSSDDILDFIRISKTDPRFSGDYINSLLFAENTLLFYESGDIVTSSAPDDKLADLIGQIITCAVTKCAQSGHKNCAAGGAVTTAVYRAIKWLISIFS